MIRLRAWLSGLWAGALLAVALLAAPAAFTVLEREAAGTFARRLFLLEANLSLALCIALFLIERRCARQSVRSGASASAVSTEMLLVLGALFCTVAGYYAVQPLMEAARAGQGRFSFGALHAASSLAFAVKAMCVGVLAWRTAGAAPDVLSPRPSS